MATNGSFAHQEQYKAATDPMAGAPGSIDAGAAAGTNNLSKDEVGWYFVEQYYTTLSKSPEKLHLFYGKRSQFVYGKEAEVANVSVGRQAIQERIKELEFQDCKVRVSNVDSQASFDNIVIQVIGETSNKAAEPKKFVQTFVLAQQPSGYFVLNDILRYIDEDTEEPAETATAAAAKEAESATAQPEPVSAPTDAKDESPAPLAEAVEKKLNAADKEAPTPSVNGNNVDASIDTAQTSQTKTEQVASLDADASSQKIAEEDAKEPARPQDPEPSPVTAQPAAAAIPKPAAPPKPMTWASRAAAAAGPRPVVPLPQTATPPAQSQNRAAPPSEAAGAPTSSSPAAGAGPAVVPDHAVKESSGWQTAGADSKRQNRPQSISTHPAEKEGTMGYVKYVTEKVQEADLRAALAAHGELTYFDINRPKNCAFVEYKTTEGYQAAITSNPHVVNGENIVVEPRRPKSTAYGGSNYASYRGGAAGRGRGGPDGNRGGGQGGSRGNMGQNRGRGGMGRGGSRS